MQWEGQVEMKGYIHAVPNFSEGRREEVINEIIGVFKGKSGIKLIDFYPDKDFNRTVVEVIGKPEPLADALVNMAGKAVELIDMETQTGAHPRIGAIDTIPIFPLLDMELEECRLLAEKIGERVFERLELPVYFSGVNARSEKRKEIGFIRKGQYEGLKEVVHLAERAPDIGPKSLHPTAGAVIISAGTEPLVAYNVVLNTEDLEIGKKIAKAVRGPSGGFTPVRAVALTFSEENKVAVSMNMFDCKQTPIYRVFELIKIEAAAYGVNIAYSELVGALSQRYLLNSLAFFLQLRGFKEEQVVENNLIGL